MEMIKINLSIETKPRSILFPLFKYNIGTDPLFFKGRRQKLLLFNEFGDFVGRQLKKELTLSNPNSTKLRT
jgi:hypothetical protein